MCRKLSNLKDREKSCSFSRLVKSCLVSFQKHFNQLIYNKLITIQLHTDCSECVDSSLRKLGKVKRIHS